MSDAENESPRTIESPDVLQRYQTAADVAQRSVEKVLEACVPGAKVVDLCVFGDETITQEVAKVKVKGAKSKGIAFPTTVSVNHVVCHYAPLKDDSEAIEALKDGDIVKINLGAHVDGYPAMAAQTMVVGASKEKPVEGRKADVIHATYNAVEAAIRMLKPGSKTYDISDTAQKVAQSYGFNALNGMMSYVSERNVLEGDKRIVINPTEAERAQIKNEEIAAYEVYHLDIMVTTGDGRSRLSPSARTTIFKKTGSAYLLKMKTSRAAFSEISTKFGDFPFTLRSMEDEKKARLGIMECVKHNLITPYNVFVDKEGEHVAQFLYTVAVLPNGPIKLAGPAGIDTDVYKSDKTIDDEDLKALLASSLRPKKKNKAKKAEQ